MLPTDRAEFLSILTGLAAVKPGAKLSPEALDVWWGAMRYWRIEDFRAAAAHLVSSVEFMPSPFHFEQLRRTGRQTAGEAWAVVVEHVRSGKWRTERLPPGVDAAARAIGGCHVIAMSEEAKLPYLERRFAEHYDARQDAEEVRTALPALAAIQAAHLLKRIP